MKELEGEDLDNLECTSTVATLTHHSSSFRTYSL